MNFNYQEPSKYEQVSFICKMCGEPAYFDIIPTRCLERKMHQECSKIYDRDARNRRIAKLSVQAK